RPAAMSSMSRSKPILRSRSNGCATCFRLSVTPTASTSTKRVFSSASGVTWRSCVGVIVRAAALHLLEIERRLHIAQTDQHLQRLHVGAGGDHVDCDGNARVVIGAKLANQLLGIGAVGAVGDLFREIVALPKDLADDPDDLLGMMVVLAEDQGLQHLAAAG